MAYHEEYLRAAATPLERLLREGHTITSSLDSGGYHLESKKTKSPIDRGVESIRRSLQDQLPMLQILLEICCDLDDSFNAEGSEVATHFLRTIMEKRDLISQSEDSEKVYLFARIIENFGRTKIAKLLTHIDVISGGIILPKNPEGNNPQLDPRPGQSSPANSNGSFEMAA